MSNVKTGKFVYELPSPTTSEMVSTIPKQYSKARSQCHYSVGKPFGILANVVRCALWRREQTPCIFYVPQVLDLLDSWRNPLYTVFNVPICFHSSTNICLRKGDSSHNRLHRKGVSRTLFITNIKKMESDEEIKGKAYVHWKSWQVAYKGIVDQNYLDSLTLENRLWKSE